MWRDQTTFPNPAFWRERYRKHLFFRHSENYLASHDRDVFLSDKLDWINERLVFIEADHYKREIVQLWQHARHDRIPLSRIVEQIEKCRLKHEAVQPGAREYEFWAHQRVGDFVYVKEPRRIIKFLIYIELFRHFKEVIEVLQKNRRTGGLRDKTEAKILSQVLHGEQLNKSESTAQTGFKWIGAKVPERMGLLYDHLINRKYIHKSTSIEQFQIAFSDKPVDSRIIWTNTAATLLLFIDAMIDKEFLAFPQELVKKRERIKQLSVARNRGELTDEQDAEYRAALHQINSWLYARITACFLNKKGEPHTGDTLKHARSDLYNKQKRPLVIDEFVRLADRIASY